MKVKFRFSFERVIRLGVISEIWVSKEQKFINKKDKMNKKRWEFTYCTIGNLVIRFDGNFWWWKILRNQMEAEKGKGNKKCNFTSLWNKQITSLLTNSWKIENSCCWWCIWGNCKNHSRTIFSLNYPLPSRDMRFISYDIFIL
jgi:hypothetical protein